MIQVENYIKSLTETLNLINQDAIKELKGAFELTKVKKNQIITFGNGGSGSTASHMVCDILKGCSYGKVDRYKILCLNDNIPTLLAYSNDVSYDDVFVEQLKNYMSEGDLVIGISGSGNSKNVIKAFDYANANGAITVGFTGFNGGILKDKSQISIHVPIDDMQITEDVHVIIMHMLYKLLN
jgi:D-sedoheptulose 7-phosphate isomerase